MPFQFLPNYRKIPFFNHSFYIEANVIIVSDKCDPEIIKGMHIKHAYTLDEALQKARSIVGENEKITVIPDGISVILR